MAAFQETREQTEQRVLVHLLTEIERNPMFTQRSLAGELGIALGLMNSYLKSCVTKGWIRASQISPKRISYFLTPEGFAEKSLMVKDYLARSLTFFRDARAQCEEAFQVCHQQGWTRIALIGHGDLADIACLVSSGSSLTVQVVDASSDLHLWDAIVVTDVVDPQGTFDGLKSVVDSSRLITLKILHISRGAS